MSTDGSLLGYGELLRLAGTKDLLELDSTLVQIPSDANGGHAVVLATARTGRGLYRAVGEAWRDLLPAVQRAYVLTVAEQRAKTRVLCEAVGMPQPLPAEMPLSAVQEAPPVVASTERAVPRQVAPPTAVPPSAPAPVAKATSPEPVRPDPVIVEQGQSLAEVPVMPTPDVAPSVAESEEAEPVANRTRQQTKQSAAPPPAEGLGPDIIGRLLQMTRLKAELEGAEISDDEAMRKLDSFFQRAFGHSMAEGSRMEGQRVVRRLAGELERLKADRDPDAVQLRG